MSAKPVIPTPRTERWRQWRTQYVPGTIFVGVLVATGLIWKNFILPVSLVGKVEAKQAEVSSPRAGQVFQLQVTRFQKVKQGDPIAQVVTTDAHILAASLAVIQAEVEMIRAGMVPMQDNQRNAINYEQLRLDWMEQRTELATARVKLQLAETELRRMEQLNKEAIASQSEYDAAQTTAQAYRVEVEEKTRLVEQSGHTLARLQEVQDATMDPQAQIKAAIALQEEKLNLTEAQLSPISLVAPIDGLVTFIHRWNGENVAIGDPIVTISASQSDRIVGYLRQPLYIQPQTNMLVHVRTRGAQRMEGTGRIIAVGAQLQPMNDIYLPPMKNIGVEIGLPILVSMPTTFKAQPGAYPVVHPGEYVDMTILPRVE